MYICALTYFFPYFYSELSIYEYKGIDISQLRVAVCIAPFSVGLGSSPLDSRQSIQAINQRLAGDQKLCLGSANESRARVKPGMLGCEGSSSRSRSPESSHNHQVLAREVWALVCWIYPFIGAQFGLRWVGGAAGCLLTHTSSYIR